MNHKKKFSGVVVPAVTPLMSSFQLDEVAVEKMFILFARHEAQPFILGTTGEAASLPLKLKEQFIRTAGKLKTAHGHLYAGISSNVLKESIAMARLCGDSGIDGVVATVPSYYTLTDKQTRQYFESLADASPVPVIIYNIPATTHVSLPLALIDDLSKHPNIVGAKDSERSEERLLESISLWKDRVDFSHFVGWAAKSADALLGGSDGIIPSTGNFAPEIYNDLLQAAEAGNIAEAHRLQKLSDDLGAVYQAGKTLGESLWALKIVMHELALCEPVVMPPLQPLGDEAAGQIVESFKHIKY